MKNEETKYVRWLAPRQSGNSPALQCWVWSPERAKSRRDDRGFCRPSGIWLHARSGSQRSSAGLFSKNETVPRLANNAISMSPREALWRCGRHSCLPVRAAFQSPVGKTPDWKVRRTGRLEGLPYDFGTVISPRREASWSAPVLWRFGRSAGAVAGLKWRFFEKNRPKSVGQGPSGE